MKQYKDFKGRVIIEDDFLPPDGFENPPNYGRKGPVIMNSPLYENKHVSRMHKVPGQFESLAFSR